MKTLGTSTKVKSTLSTKTYLTLLHIHCNTNVINWAPTFATTSSCYLQEAHIQSNCTRWRRHLYHYIIPFTKWPKNRYFRTIRLSNEGWIPRKQSTFYTPRREVYFKNVHSILQGEKPFCHNCRDCLHCKGVGTVAIYKNSSLTIKFSAKISVKSTWELPISNSASNNHH